MSTESALYIPTTDELISQSLGFDVYLLQDGTYAVQDHIDGMPCMLYVKQIGSSFAIGTTEGRIDTESELHVTSCLRAYSSVYYKMGLPWRNCSRRLLESLPLAEMPTSELQVWIMRLAFDAPFPEDKILRGESALRDEVRRIVALALERLGCEQAK